MKKTKVGRLFYLSMKNKDLQNFWGGVKAEDVARYLEAKGKVQLVEEEGELYYIEEKGADLTRKGLRQLLISELTKDSKIVLDKKRLKLVKYLCGCFDCDKESA